jgi:hypothetical protein
MPVPTGKVTSSEMRAKKVAQLQTTYIASAVSLKPILCVVPNVSHPPTTRVFLPGDSPHRILTSHLKFLVMPSEFGKRMRGNNFMSCPLV